MKFLVDECLSPELTKLAHAKGHGESSHVVWMKLAGKLSPRRCGTAAAQGRAWTFTKN
jgi:hypothetical protein